MTATVARNLLATDLAGVERLARTTPNTVLQESLANAYVAVAALRAVKLKRHR